MERKDKIVRVNRRKITDRKRIKLLKIKCLPLKKRPALHELYGEDTAVNQIEYIWVRNVSTALNL